MIALAAIALATAGADRIQVAVDHANAGQFLLICMGENTGTGSLLIDAELSARRREVVIDRIVNKQSTTYRFPKETISPILYKPSPDGSFELNAAGQWQGKPAQVRILLEFATATAVPKSTVWLNLEGLNQELQCSKVEAPPSRPVETGGNIVTPVKSVGRSN